MSSETIKKYLREFMCEQTGLSVAPLLEAGLIYAGGPNNAWALTELGVEMLYGKGAEPMEDAFDGGLEIEVDRGSGWEPWQGNHYHESWVFRIYYPEGWVAEVQSKE